MEPISFSDLSLHPSILEVLEKEGYSQPTPVQQEAIPHALKGQDVLAIAQTGTGKTAAFLLPIIHNLHESKKGSPGLRALVVTPTRELALQVFESMRTYSKNLPLRSTAVHGGVSAGPQISSLRKKPDLLVATPGRLLDLIQQRHISLKEIEYLVLDEADRMLDMGFIHDVKKIVAMIPPERQTLFFSATMPDQVERLASTMLHDPARVEVAPSSTVADKIEQKIYFVDRAKKQTLLSHFLKEGHTGRTIVFARTKHRADRVAKFLKRDGIAAEAIHSDKTQGARQRALAAFAKGKVEVLVATDIVSRGIDVEEVNYVVNFDLPDDPENYVHRIGRTARAGAEGIALSFSDPEEDTKLRAIEKIVDHQIPKEIDHPFHSEEAQDAYQSSSNTSLKGSRRGRGGPPRSRPRGTGHARGKPRPASNHSESKKAPAGSRSPSKARKKSKVRGPSSNEGVKARSGGKSSGGSKGGGHSQKRKAKPGPGTGNRPPSRRPKKKR